MPVETFLARVEALAQFRPSDYERSWMERKRHYVTLAESVLRKEYGYSIDYRTSPSKGTKP
jgi:RNase P subunit RPR2